MNPKRIELSIVIPCLNESETLEFCITKAFQALHTNHVTGEVIVADNSSDDNSVEIAEKLGAQVVSISEKGYGNALAGGILEAKGDYVLMGDADGSYNFGQLNQFLKKLRDGYELVMGCRFPRHGGTIKPGAMPWKHRWIGNPILSGVGKLFFNTAINDFHCGLRAFNRQAIIKLNLQTKGMEFASEMVVKAAMANLKICEIPITLYPDKRSKPPHLRSWRDGWRHLRFMLLFSPNWLFIIPGLALTAIGVIGFAILFDKPLKVGAITFDLNSLLVFGVGMLTGFQILSFGIFIKAYAANIGLIPGKSIWRRIINGYAVECGIIAGFILMLTGLALLVYNVLNWKAVGFGPLPYQASMRMVILSAILIGIGIQSTLYGFALNIIGLEK